MLLSAFSLVVASAVATAFTDLHHPAPYGHWVTAFDNLVTFGDSYTDESRLGYFINHNGAPPPAGLLLPPSTNTAGGGTTWARFVSESTGAKLFNYAVSGAVCSNSIIYRYFSPVKGPFPDVVYEVQAFIADTKYINASTGTNTLYTNRQKANTVYAMWIGTNDLGNYAFLTDSSLNMTVIPDYINCIFDRFDEIYANGGRYFVLMNTAPLELSPLYGMPGAGGLPSSHYWPDKPANISEYSSKMKEYTQTVNDVFDYRTPYEVLIAKRYPGSRFAVFDVHALLTDIYYNPGPYLASPANVTGQYEYCAPPSGNTCTFSSESADHFLWYDELHPSQQADKAIAAEFVKVTQGTSAYAAYWQVL